VHIHLRNTVNARDEVGMANVEQDGWSPNPSRADGYGDGINWSGWVRTNEIHSWQSNPAGVTCGVIGYDVLNNIPHYKP
ncbi:2733_t:CDS:2, partial [Funneliformis caledonium]